jgi:hypothetical protein
MPKVLLFKSKESSGILAYWGDADKRLRDMWTYFSVFWVLIKRKRRPYEFLFAI